MLCVTAGSHNSRTGDHWLSSGWQKCHRFVPLLSLCVCCPLCQNARLTLAFVCFKVYFVREGGGRAREERERWICCLLHAPQPGIEPTTRACALTGNQTGDPSVTG